VPVKHASRKKNVAKTEPDGATEAAKSHLGRKVVAAARALVKLQSFDDLGAKLGLGGRCVTTGAELLAEVLGREIEGLEGLEGSCFVELKWETVGGTGTGKESAGVLDGDGEQDKVPFPGVARDPELDLMVEQWMAGTES